MRHGDRILLINDDGGPACMALAENFAVQRLAADRLQDIAGCSPVQLVVIRIDATVTMAALSGDNSPCARVLAVPAMADVPVLALISACSLQDKLAALDAGCDDVIDEAASPAEIIFRAQKAILHKRANAQLRSMARQASEVAFSAMADSGNLGVNIRFLLASYQCDSLDQLGMLFFDAARNYGLSCSLQLRSDFGVKNMEATGLSKDLESQLLTQLCHVGRYYDFGSRTVCNYGRASVLIRNMPLEDPLRYGSVKDNSFTLLQGLDARIMALDNARRVQQEHESLREVSLQARQVMSSIETGYQSVMRRIAGVVDDMAEHVERMIPRLALNLEQEQFLEKLTHDCVRETTRVFNEGLRVDEIFSLLLQEIDAATSAADPGQNVQQLT